MAEMFGTKTSGKTGQLSHEEIAALIYKKSNERAAEGACKKCATHIQDMKSTSDQGGITTKYAGKSVFHISSGKRGGTDGCTVFFTLSQDNGPGLTAGIVGVGWHAGDSDHVYELDWGKGAPFFTGNRFDSARQFQKGYKLE